MSRTWVTWAIFLEVVLHSLLDQFRHGILARLQEGPANPEEFLGPFAARAVFPNEQRAGAGNLPVERGAGLQVQQPRQRIRDFDRIVGGSLSWWQDAVWGGVFKAQIGGKQLAWCPRREVGVNGAAFEP